MSARTVTRTATAAVHPTVMHHTPAHAPPPSPIRSRPTKVSVAAAWMPRDMGRPVVGGVQQDVPREVPQRRADVVEPVDDPQILVRRGEASGDAPLPAVDEREREGPRRRRGPHGGQQPPPPKPVRHPGPVRDDQYGDGDRRRGPRAHVGIPMGVQGCPVDVQVAVVVLDVPAHERGRRDQGGGGCGGEQVTARPGGGWRGAGGVGGSFELHTRNARRPHRPYGAPRGRVTEPSDLPAPIRGLCAIRSEQVGGPPPRTA